ncbi:hypothetical protein [Aliikangiella sp. G2MR2-5]|uniref:hypothetical protein n=1 Tax=Aliikangiella sp. G2MR2-5 TaxID=2788943 RepID=UPI0018A8EFE4|nr:hypothetical protein [Aliikangiella sp. G2MR2-5]
MKLKLLGLFSYSILLILFGYFLASNNEAPNLNGRANQESSTLKIEFDSSTGKTNRQFKRTSLVIVDKDGAEGTESAGQVFTNADVGVKDVSNLGEQELAIIKLDTEKDHIYESLFQVSDEDFQSMREAHLKLSEADSPDYNYEDKIYQYSYQQNDVSIEKLNCFSVSCEMVFRFQSKESFAQLYKELARQDWWNATGYITAIDDKQLKVHLVRFGDVRYNEQDGSSESNQEESLMDG